MSWGELPAEGTAHAEGWRQDAPGHGKDKRRETQLRPGWLVSRSDLGLGVAQRGSTAWLEAPVTL